jgi:hypothetical protein
MVAAVVLAVNRPKLDALIEEAVAKDPVLGTLADAALQPDPTHRISSRRAVEYIKQPQGFRP